MDTKQQKDEVTSPEKYKFKGQVFAALIGALAIIIVAIINLSPQFMKPKSQELTSNTVSEIEISLCKKIKEKAELYSIKCRNTLGIVTNKRQRIDLLYLQERMDEITNYECGVINEKFDEIMEQYKNFYESIKKYEK